MQKSSYAFVGLLGITIALTMAVLAGCGNPAVTGPTVNEVTGVEILLVPKVKTEAVGVRWPFWASDSVTVKNDDTQEVLKTEVLTKQHNSYIFELEPDTRVRVYAPLYASDPPAKAMYVTTGVSPQILIEAGKVKTAVLTLTSTKPKCTVVAPINGGTVNTKNNNVRVRITDLGAGTPAVVLTDNGVPVPADAKTVTGDSINGWLYSWALVQDNGPHAMRLVATSTSHLSTTNSGVGDPLSWSYNVKLPGGIGVTIQGKK